MMTCSIRRTSRKQHRFRPNLGDSRGQLGLETRSLAAVPYFALSVPTKSGQLETGAATNSMQAQGLDGKSFGGGRAGTYDFVYGASGNSATSSTSPDNNQPVANQVSDSASVSCAVTGPGTINPGDPNTSPVAQTIGINVTHENWDKFANNTGHNFGATDLGTSDTRADTKPGDYEYFVGGGPQGGSTVTITFHVTLTTTATDASLFNVNASLNLMVGSNPMNPMLHVKIDSTGYDATGSGMMEQNDPNFGRQLGGTTSEDATATLNLTNGAAFPVGFTSDLSTSLKNPAIFPAGNSTNDTQFHWTLAIQVS